MEKAVVYLTSGDKLDIDNYNETKQLHDCGLAFYDKCGKLQLIVNKNLFSHMTIAIMEK